MTETARPAGSWDRPPTKRFWVVLLSGIAAVVIVVAAFIGLTDSSNTLYEKANKGEKVRACGTLSTNVNYRECMDDAWGTK